MITYLFMDIPYSCIEEYLKDVELKKGICKALPRARMVSLGDDAVRYSGLVCCDIGGKSTGVGALGCYNCKERFSVPM